jgi:hypothetical protein
LGQVFAALPAGVSDEASPAMGLPGLIPALWMRRVLLCGAVLFCSAWGASGFSGGIR